MTVRASGENQTSPKRKQGNDSLSLSCRAGFRKLWLKVLSERVSHEETAMTRSVLFFPAVVISCIWLLSQTGTAQPDVPKELEPFQGTWMLVSYTVDGKEWTEAERKT